MISTRSRPSIQEDVGCFLLHRRGSSYSIAVLSFAPSSFPSSLSLFLRIYIFIQFTRRDNLRTSRGAAINITAVAETTGGIDFRKRRPRDYGLRSSARNDFQEALQQPLLFPLSSSTPLSPLFTHWIPAYTGVTSAMTHARPSRFITRGSQERTCETTRVISVNQESIVVAGGGGGDGTMATSADGRAVCRLAYPPRLGRLTRA